MKHFQPVSLLLYSFQHQRVAAVSATATATAAALSTSMFARLEFISFDLRNRSPEH